MKSTYEIPGLFWDSLPINTEVPGLASADSLPLLVGTPRNLFDLISFRRAVPLSELFKLPTSSLIESLIAPLADCAEVVIVVDYYPRALGSVPRAFYEKRLAQALSLIQKLLPNVKISVSNWGVVA